MKKTFSLIAVLVFISLLAVKTATAQIIGVNNVREFTVVEKGTAASSLGARAARNFVSEFSDVHNESWSRNEEGYRARFTRDGILYLVDYDRKGNWLNTIRVYDQDKLDANIRRSVKMAYPDFDIVKINELKKNNIMAYFIKIEGNASLKTVRLMDGEMDVVEDYRKR